MITWNMWKVCIVIDDAVEPIIRRRRAVCPVHENMKSQELVVLAQPLI
jgi:hypothetical protein